MASMGDAVVLLLTALTAVTGAQDSACTSSPATLQLCSVCAESFLAMPLEECCSAEDSTAVQLCDLCLTQPERCEHLLEEVYDEEDEKEDFDNGVVEKRASAGWGGSKRGSFWYLNSAAPVRRAKYFLGKRASAMWDVKRLRNNFLGKRDAEENFLDYEEKRARPFLGKRARPFLGKRARPFLGKRSELEDEEEHTEDRSRHHKDEAPDPPKIHQPPGCVRQAV